MRQFIRRINRYKSEARRLANQAESPADKAARRTANATVVLAIFTALLALLNVWTVWVLRNQLKEMHAGGIDTHALAGAAESQACSAQKNAQAARDFAGTADKIKIQMTDAVGKLNIQSMTRPVIVELTTCSHGC